jgi:disulfide bond formation protein DsbB
MPAAAFALQRWPIVAFIASAAMLAAAHAFETFGHLPPCHLCLKQREAYWIALAVAAAAIALQRLARRAPWRRIAGALLAAVFAYGAYLAAFQAGAEWRWWPAPQGCSSAGPVSASALQALMRGAAAATPPCDKATWIFLGLSMAGWNFLASAALAALSLASTLPKAHTVSP